jgi:DNA repair protein RecN (Recombination protein N)
MITSLAVKNFALIENLKINFQDGLNIITGESGAGKSILINALNQLCGERSNLDLIKSGQKKAVIEAEFNLNDNKRISDALLSQPFTIENGSLIIRKEINESGMSRIFINDTPVQLAILSQVSNYLIDLHGQHQHQALLHPENHLTYLDSFAGLHSSVTDFTRLVDSYSALINKIKTLEKDRSGALQMTDLFKFQLQELNLAGIEKNELNKLNDELRILANFEKVHAAGQSLTQSLSLDEFNASQIVTRALKNINDLASIDEQFNELRNNLTSALEAIEEVSQFVERYLSNLEFDPDKAEQIRQRIAQLDFLLKKYQKVNSDELLDLAEELKVKLSQIDNYDDHLKKLDTEKKQLEKIILNSGMELSQKRKQAAQQFENLLTNFLKEIGMDNSRFEFQQEFIADTTSPFTINEICVKLLPTGFDDILIKFSPNPGEALKPINKIASGGELSRIMLALKSVLAEKDHIPLLVFDEIDNGISGKVAQIVGKKIGELSRYHQIICITHLPQIAAFADSHYKVNKITDNTSTRIEIEMLEVEDRVKEIANLLGGVNLSKEAMDNASQLLTEASKIK